MDGRDSDPAKRGHNGPPREVIEKSFVTMDELRKSYRNKDAFSISGTTIFVKLPFDPDMIAVMKRVFACEPPDVAPLAGALQLLRIGLLAGEDLGQLVGGQIAGDFDIHANVKQHSGLLIRRGATCARGRRGRRTPPGLHRARARGPGHWARSARNRCNRAVRAEFLR